MGSLMRHLFRGLRTHMIRIFTRKKKTILFHSKEYHISPQFKHLYPNYEDEHELILKLSPIKKYRNIDGKLCKQEVPMGYMRKIKKLDVVHIEVEDAN